MSEPDAPIFEEETTGSTETVGEQIDDGRGRIFPCEQCGADLEFSIGQQSLQCPYCGHVKQLAPTDEEIRENDYQQMLEQLKTLRKEGAEQQATLGDHEVRCNSCGANVVFSGTLTSSTCPYCAAPLQRDKIHDAETRIPVDAVLPFLVPRERAAANLREWVRTRWFAPNEFKRDGANGKFNGCYLPYFTFDSATFTRYAGQRGDHYWVTVQHGKDTRRERRTRWSSASGEFDRFFDDVLAVAAKDEYGALLQALEPWPLGKCVPYTPEVLAGLFARTYDIPLEMAFQAAKQRIDAALHADICRRIGGDEQRVASQKTAYNALTFKHLLLPVWLLAYRYKQKPYRVSVNAATGEVNGERPYSWVKITLFVLMCAAIVLTLFALTQR
jgi:rubrerythrin